MSGRENAIAFYRKHGFEMIGFDLYAYSNADPERHEIRVEMGKRLGESERSGDEAADMTQRGAL